MERVFCTFVLFLTYCIIHECSCVGTYVGCYQDTADRAMPGGHVRLISATVDKCIDRCREKGFFFAGIQDASACFCANEFHKHGQAPESECSSVCPGNSAQKCGSPWRNSVWETGAYVGCYKDTADRAMPGGYVRLDGATVEKCIDRCGKKGYFYAGVQDTTACFCANEFAKHGPRPDSECNRPCPGNPEQKCGAPWRNSVWKTGYVGCYQDTADRAMPGGFVRLEGATVAKCINRCADKGFLYAGVQDTSACFCANVFDKHGPAPESECNRQCPGNSAQECGGPWRNSVWKTGAYVGCYKDTSDRAMPGGYVRLDGATVTKCRKRCAEKGFLYAGIQDTSACFCANEFDKHGEASESECGRVCPGNSAQKCGGPWRNSVWETGVYVGCYKDTSDRAMPGGYVRLTGATVGKCIDRCAEKGFFYAGIQDTNACFCANVFDKHGEVSDSECSRACPGNSAQKCGAPWRNSVWETGAYVGCYKDTGDRAMPGGFVRITGATIEKCIDRCRLKGFFYAGIQDKTACFCANVFDKHGEASGSECGDQCPGNSAQRCGGPWRNSVWETGAYVGCYKDTGDRAMPGGYVRIPNADLEKCIDRCRQQGVSYAGMQDTTACFCADEYAKHGPAPESECNRPCPGNSAQRCGGPWRNSVWEID